MRSRKRFAAAWLLCSLLLAPAAQALRFERIELDGAHYSVAHVDPARDALRLFPAPVTGNSFARIAAELGPRPLLFAMNAGMYQEDRSPVGLLVVGGRQLRALNRRRANPNLNFYMLPNGAFALSPSGARVLPTADYAAQDLAPVLATQSGPMLVVDGAIHPRFSPVSRSRNIRNGVGVDAKGAVVFAISDVRVTFHQFASLFRDRLQCPNALFLDGSVSSLHAPELGRSDPRADLGPVIGVVGEPAGK